MKWTTNRQKYEILTSYRWGHYRGVASWADKYRQSLGRFLAFFLRQTFAELCAVRCATHFY